MKYNTIHGMVALLALAVLASLGCSGDSPTAAGPPDGPFFEITLPDFIDDQAPNVLEVRAGVRTRDKVTYTAGATVIVDIDEGDSDNTSGVTDADGRFATTVVIEPNSENGVRGEVTVKFPNDSVLVRTFDRRRNNIVEMVSRSIGIGAAAEFVYLKSEESELVVVFDDLDGVFDDSPSQFDDAVLMQRAQSVENMSVQTEAASALRAGIGLLDDGTLKLDATFEVSARLEVTNPDMTLELFEAECHATAVISMTVRVWGGEAKLNMTALIDDIFHSIDIENVYSCRYNPDEREEVPLCGNDRYSVSLPPGLYQVKIRVGTGLEMGSDGGQVSGIANRKGSAEFDVTIGHDVSD